MRKAVTMLGAPLAVLMLAGQAALADDNTANLADAPAVASPAARGGARIAPAYRPADDTRTTGSFSVQRAPPGDQGTPIAFVTNP